MEYCGAGSVCDLMAICERTLNEAQISAIMKMSLLGLEYLHNKKKIHRDIKVRKRKKETKETKERKKYDTCSQISYQ
jgi:serine/threonine protein kinase